MSHYKTPATTAGKIFNKYSRPTIGYGVTVWKFKSLKELDTAYREAVEAIGESFISLAKIRLHRSEPDPFGKKVNYIQIFD